MRDELQWLNWAKELQALAQAGLAYGKDIYDIERYERIREISAEILSHQTNLSFAQVKDLFCGDTGYQTPKLDTRAAIFLNERILLVQERDGLWALPGGWVDVNCTIAENAVKEVLEETGLTATAERLIAVQDRAHHTDIPHAYSIVKVFVLCRMMGGSFRANSETIATDYFSEDALPPLSLGKTTPEQVKMCLSASRDPYWQVLFD